ncbi:MAG: hypothetical protein MUC83_10800 [Pirellula sp.]|nr:hypothetical protein [Pirellula sp.]
MTRASDKTVAMPPEACSVSPSASSPSGTQSLRSIDQMGWMGVPEMVSIVPSGPMISARAIVLTSRVMKLAVTTDP